MLTNIPPMGGIPSANRTGRRLSAIPHITLSTLGHPSKTEATDQFRPRVIAPDAAVQRARTSLQKALAAKREQLRAILADLETQGDKIFQQEAALVRRQIERLKGE